MTPAAEKILKVLWDLKYHYASVLFAEAGAEYPFAIRELKANGYSVEVNQLKTNGRHLFRLVRREPGSPVIELELPVEDVELLVVHEKISSNVIQKAAEALSLAGFPFEQGSATEDEKTQFASIPEDLFK